MSTKLIEFSYARNFKDFKEIIDLVRNNKLERFSPLAMALLKGNLLEEEKRMQLKLQKEISSRERTTITESLEEIKQAKKQFFAFR